MKTTPTRYAVNGVSTPRTTVEIMAAGRESEELINQLRPLLKRVIVKQKGDIAVRGDMEAAQQIFNLMELGKK